MNTMTRLYRIAVALSALLCLTWTGAARAELMYEQPYLGEWPSVLQKMYGAEVWKQRAEDNLAATVQQSDAIIVADATKLTESKSLLDKDTIEFYEADVKLVDTLKGEPKATSMHLRFTPSATGLEAGARHMFFMKRAGTGFQVVKASYIFPEGKGYDNHMRLVDMLDGSTDLGLDTVRYLATGKIPNNFASRLMEEYTNASYMKMSTAVYIAAATPALSQNVLKKVVSGGDDKRFEPKLYGAAAYALASHNTPDAWQALLTDIPRPKSYGNIAESIAFDLVARFGDDQVIPSVQAVVKKNPELAISAAYALSRIGTPKARVAIDAWLADADLATRTVKVSADWPAPTAEWMEPTLSFGFLFKHALSKIGHWDK